MILQLLSVVALGLMCGSEFNVAAVAHPLLDRQPRATHVLVRSSLAALLGRVMPFWMPVSAILNLLVLLPFESLTRPAWHLAATAFGIQVVACVFSLMGPVPINNRIATWTVERFPRIGSNRSNVGTSIIGCAPADS